MHPADLREDLRQEMFLILCEMEEERLQAMHESNFLRNYLSGMCRNMAKSDRSTFYKVFRRERERMLNANLILTVNGELQRADEYDEFRGAEDRPLATIFTPPGLIEVEEDPERDYLAYINEAMKLLHPYEQDMIRMYVDAGYNCRPIAEGAGIPERSVRLAVANAREKLKKALRK